MQKIEFANYKECSSLRELLKVRDFNHDILFKTDNIFATAVGFKWKNNHITNIPAILVFVKEKTDGTIIHPVPAVLYHEQDKLWCATDVLPGYVNSDVPTEPLTDENEQIASELRNNSTITGGSALFLENGSRGTTSCVLKGDDGEFYAMSNNHVVSKKNTSIFFRSGINMGVTTESENICEVDDELGNTPCEVIDIGLVKLNTGISVAPGTYQLNDGLENPERVDEDSMDIIGTRIWGAGSTSGLCEGYIAAYSFSEKTKTKSKIASFLIVSDSTFFSRRGDSGMLLLAKSAGASDVANVPVGVLYAGWSMKLRQENAEDWTYAMGMGPVMDFLKLKNEQFTWRA